MDDLRRRFATLDDQPMPDLWSDIERRLGASSPSGVVAPVAAGGSVRPRGLGGRPFALLLAAVLLLAMLIVGALVAGRGTDSVPAIVIRPAPSTLVPPTRAPGGVASTGHVVYTQQERIADDAECDPRPWRCFRSTVMVAEADGTNARPLLPDEPGFGFLAWSPDGTHVVGTDEFGDLRIAAFDGTPTRLIGSYDTLCSPRCTNIEDVSFSPDGTRLAFPAVRSPESGDTSVIAILELATGRITELGSTATDNDGMFCDTSADEGMNDPPRWSPDGARLVFARQVIGPRDGDGYCQSTIFVVDADGANLRQIVPPALHPLVPRWSPDGAWVAFHSADMAPSTGQDDVVGTVTDIYLVRPDGSDLRPLTTGGASAWPSWTRDGRITYIRWLDRTAQAYEVWIMDADGSDASRLEDPSLAGLSAIGCVECPYRTGPDQTRAYWQPTD
jgi:hypothetical protein